MLADSVDDLSAALATLAGMRQALCDLQTGVAAQARRVEACEVQLALISYPLPLFNDQVRAPRERAKRQLRSRFSASRESLTRAGDG